MQIKFRPHHFLCALNFQGSGYSPAFVKNFSAIINMLNAPNGDDVVISITDHTDSICSPCPHRTHTTCTSQEKILGLDRAHAEALSILPNTMITWGKAKERIAEKISLNVFHEICSTCSWKEYGICEASLLKFLEEK